jgi:pimeloyl-ACP methyl ester carboxylesterase
LPAVTGSTMLVVVNGLGGLAWSWARFTAALPAGLETLVLDLPGHGEVAPAADYRYGAIVAQVDVRVAGLDHFALLGHSVGGAVAWLYAARHPDRVSRLILVEPAAPHQSPFLRGPAPAPVHPYSFASPAEAQQWLVRLDPSVTEEDVRRDYRQRGDGRWEPDHDPAIFPALVEDGREHGDDFRAELGLIRTPTLVVWAERTFTTAEQRAEIVDAIPNARSVVVEGAGHLVNRERPGALAALVAEFLRAG